MAYFPLFIDLEGKAALVVGGGPVAARKVRVLLDYGLQVRVCAPRFIPELEDLPGIERLNRPFAPELLDGAALVITATDDRTVNHLVSSLCRARSIPVNVADSREESTFLFPSVVRRGRLSVGISTGGASPTASSYVRRELERTLPQALGPILDWMEALRRERKAALSPETRHEAFAELFSAALEAGRPLTPEETRRLLEHQGLQ